jgi:hypothetical protein
MYTEATQNALNLLPTALGGNGNPGQYINVIQLYTGGRIFMDRCSSVTFNLDPNVMSLVTVDKEDGHTEVWDLYGVASFIYFPLNWKGDYYPGFYMNP